MIEQMPLVDLEPASDHFREDVLAGLTKPTKSLPCKYLYDERGSALFERICELDEYYPTRTELAIMRRHVGEMAAELGPRCFLVEYGSGSSVKVRLLLDHLDDPVAYVPIDISKEHLLRSAVELSKLYPKLEVLPVCADFTQRIELPECQRFNSHTVIYFPGSTIGNFTHLEARAFLRGAAELCGSGGGLLIGVDLKKDAATLEAAYNDRTGVTAEFTTNLLARMNRELGADFQLDRFRHVATYNRDEGRVEIRLVSLCPQTVKVGGLSISFEKGEAIRTEYSHKYSLAEFRLMAAAAGFTTQRVWTDPRDLFSVQYLTAD